MYKRQAEDRTGGHEDGAGGGECGGRRGDWRPARSSAPHGRQTTALAVSAPPSALVPNMACCWCGWEDNNNHLCTNGEPGDQCGHPCCAWHCVIIDNWCYCYHCTADVGHAADGEVGPPGDGSFWACPQCQSRRDDRPFGPVGGQQQEESRKEQNKRGRWRTGRCWGRCLLYTSDAADEL